MYRPLFTLVAPLVAVLVVCPRAVLADDATTDGGGAAAVVDVEATTTRRIGIGMEQMLTGPRGPAFVYESGPYHLVGFPGLRSNAATAGGAAGEDELRLAARYYYRVHEARSADLSVGGGIGLVNIGQ